MKRPSKEERFLMLLQRLRHLGPGLPPFEEMGVTPAQFTLLDWINSSPGCSIQDLADGLNLTPPTVSVAIQRLIKGEYIERRHHPTDRRSFQLYLTSSGAALHRQIQVYRQQKAYRILAGLASSDQEKLLALLETALEDAEKRIE